MTRHGWRMLARWLVVRGCAAAVATLAAAGLFYVFLPWLSPQPARQLGELVIGPTLPLVDWWLLRTPFRLGTRFVSISLAVVGVWQIGTWMLGPNGPAALGSSSVSIGNMGVLRAAGAFVYGRWGPVLGSALYGVWLALLLHRLRWRAILLVPAAALPFVPLLPLVYSSPTGSSPLPASPAPLDLAEFAIAALLLGLLWAYQGLLVGVLLAWIRSHSATSPAPV